MSADSDQRTLASALAPGLRARGRSRAVGLAARPHIWWRPAGRAAGVVRARLDGAAHMQVRSPPPPLWSFPRVVQPLVEELAFRGVLQGWLLQRGAPRASGPSRSPTSARRRPSWHGTSARNLRLGTGGVVPSLVFGHLRERFASVLR